MILVQPSAHKQRDALLKLFTSTPDAIIHVACRSANGSFYGGQLLLIEASKMVIRNWRSRKESVPKKLKWLEFHTVPAGTPPMVLGAPVAIPDTKVLLQAIAA